MPNGGTPLLGTTAGSSKRIIILGVSILDFILGIVVVVTVLDVFDNGSTRDEDMAKTVIGLVIVLLAIFAITIIAIMWPFIKKCLRW